MFDYGGRLTEADSRPVPYTRAEGDWARERPPLHRVHAPDVGDTVLYRHEDWAAPTEATVVWVQPGDDVDDPHLFTVHTDVGGRPVLHQGRPVLTPNPDPWPTVRLQTRYGLVDTREARLRGSPGWLPPDWVARYRPVPEVSGTTRADPFIPPTAAPPPAPGPTPMGGG